MLKLLPTVSMKICFLPALVLKFPNRIPVMTSLAHNKFIMTMHQCTQPDFFLAKYPIQQLQELLHYPATVRGATSNGSPNRRRGLVHHEGKVSTVSFTASVWTLSDQALYMHTHWPL